MPLSKLLKTSWSSSHNWVWSRDGNTVWEPKSWGWAEWNWLKDSCEWKKKNSRGIRSAHSRETRIERGCLKRRLNLPPGITREELELIRQRELYEQDHYQAPPVQPSSSSTDFVNIRVAPIETKVEKVTTSSKKAAKKRKEVKEEEKESKAQD